MKKKHGIPPHNETTDASPTPEQIAENWRKSADVIAALNVAFDMDMSVADAYAFVQKNRDRFEAVARAIVEDQSIADTARSIRAITSANSRSAAKKPRPRNLPVWKAQTIKAMRNERRIGASFDEFLAEAAQGNFDQLQIDEIEPEVYQIIWDELEESDAIKLATLKSWWTDAGK